jgi:hypothetical protein
METTLSQPAAAVRPVTAISLPAARLSLLCGALFVVLLAALHFVRPDLDPSWRVISEYALGKYGWMMTVAFLALGLSAISLFVAIRSQVGNLLGKIGLAFLLVGAAGPILAGLFTTDPITVPMDEVSSSGMLHSTGALLTDGILIAATLLTLSLLRVNPNWSAVRTPLVLATVLAWVFAVAFTASMAILLPANGGQLGPQVTVGWQGRLSIVAYAAWLMTAAWCVIQVRSRQS